MHYAKIRSRRTKRNHILCGSPTLADVRVIVFSRFLILLIDSERFFFILEIRQESVLDFTARILPDFQEYKILDRTDKSCPASQDSVYMILGWQTKFSVLSRIWKEWIQECRLGQYHNYIWPLIVCMCKWVTESLLIDKSLIEKKWKFRIN